MEFLFLPFKDTIPKMIQYVKELVVNFAKLQPQLDDDLTTKILSS